MLGQSAYIYVLWQSSLRPSHVFVLVVIKMTFYMHLNYVLRHCENASIITKPVFFFSEYTVISHPVLQVSFKVVMYAKICAEQTE